MEKDKPTATAQQILDLQNTLMACVIACENYNTPMTMDQFNMAVKHSVNLAYRTLGSHAIRTAWEEVDPDYKNTGGMTPTQECPTLQRMMDYERKARS
jgi:hypothetical protein